MSPVTTTRRFGGTIALAAAALAVVAPGASAHIQVAPALAAPGDPVEFVLTVPNEREESTTKVEVQVPAGVIPFSFADTPGWTRKNVTAANGALESIEWTGKLAADGYAQFRMLASTPDTPGDLQWKALQTYEDGTVERWIGAEGSDTPAPVTRVEADAPRQNAGGEGEEGQDEDGHSSEGDVLDEDGDSASATPKQDAKDAAAADRATDDDGDDGGGDETDWVSRGLAIAALVAALLASAAALGGRRRRGSTVERPDGDA